MALKLYVDTVSGRFLGALTSRIELAAPTFTRGDKVPVELHFVADGAEIAPPENPRLAVGTIGNLCALTTSWTASGNALAGVLDLDTAELAELLGPAPRLYDATLELEYVVDGNTRTVSRSCTIKNDLIRPSPAVINPALHFATLSALNALSTHLDDIAQTIPDAIDLGPVSTALSTLQQQLTALAQTVANLPAGGGSTDLTAVNLAIAQLQEQLTDLEGTVSNLPTGGGGTVDLTAITQRLDAIDAGSGNAVIAAQITAVKAQVSGAKDTLSALNVFLGGYAGQEAVIAVITTAITAIDAFIANAAPVKADLDNIVAGMSGLGFPGGVRGDWSWNNDTDTRIAVDYSAASTALTSAGTTIDAVNALGSALGQASALAAIETLIIGIKHAASNSAAALSSTASQIENINQQLSPLSQQIADKAPLRRPIVSVTASRELNGDLFDAYVRVDSASAITLTIPADLWLGETAGPEIDIMRVGAGAVTFAPGSGVTINSAGDKLSIASQFAGVSLKHVAGNTWDLVGALS